MSGMDLLRDEITEQATTLTGDAQAALAYLRRHGATDVAEALGLIGYRGNNLPPTPSRTPKPVPTWREGSAE